MSNFLTSAFSAITPQTGGRELLPIGTHICKLNAVVPVTPSHKDEVFTDNVDQLQLTFGVEGLGAINVWLNDRGYLRYDEIDETVIENMMDVINFKALGVNKTKFKSMSFAAQRKTLFGASKSGQAVRLDLMQRVTDMTFDGKGNPLPIEEQGRHTKEAWQISGRAMTALGLQEGESFEDAQGSYVRIKVAEKQNLSGDAVKRATILGSATEEDYQEYLVAVSE